MPTTVPNPAPPATPAPISCETAVRRLWDYLDGGLAAPVRAEVDAHLTTCAGCPPHFDFSCRVIAALGSAGLAGAPTEAATGSGDALRARVRAAVRVTAAG